MKLKKNPTFENNLNNLPFSYFFLDGERFSIEEVPPTDAATEDNNYIIINEIGEAKAKIKFENRIYVYEEQERINLNNSKIVEKAILLLNNNLPYSSEEIIKNFGIRTFKVID